MLKPTEVKHINLMPTNKQIYNIYNILINICYTLDMSDPVLAGNYNNDIIKGCSCGISSLRINSITSDGKISISLCVYMHHYQTGDLTKDSILDIINSKEFKEFRTRNLNYQNIKECQSYKKLEVCRGGCAASAYWYNYYLNGTKDLFSKDPYCIINNKKTNNKPEFKKEKILVHQNYLCTWIEKPK
ncbi:MAG: SPASM domain-containing protein [Bacilli bacterium]|nr:SPASM domain-containing protein [Bacilli bacterium]